MSQPMQQPFQPDATLKFTVQGSVLTSSFVAPTLRIDGYPAPSSTAGNSVLIPIQSGMHRLEVSSQWLRQYGQASLDVVITPHSQTEVFYAAPWHQFTTGSLGLQPQQRKGVGCLVAILVVLAALILVPILIGLLTS